MNDETDQPVPIWTSLPSKQRRVLGVLVEKAKTTPNAYPLTLNAITTGSNQKSNRYPIMDLDADDVEDALDALRGIKAVGEVHGDGRTVKFRHYMKDWLGVDGTELAVMAELLLRGEQSVGDLRGRAARMAKGQLSDMSVLRPVLDNLIQRKLVIPLTPAGRGQIVTHGLYSESELKRLRQDHSGGGSIESTPSAVPSSQPISSLPTSALPPAPSQPASSSGNTDLQQEVAELRAEVAKLAKEIEDIWSNIG